MSVRRVMGTETEFGISVQGQPTANPMVASSQVVNAYAIATLRARRARWDFEEESPLRDARGFDMSREVADASQLTDEDLGLANVILTNGARLYVDHAHPEYSTPECTNPRDIVKWDKAGEQVMLDAAALRRRGPRGRADPALQEQHRQQGRVVRRPRELPDAPQHAVRRHRRHLTPFFVSRQVVCGAGRVGIGQDGREHGFQISQRADYFEVEVGLETTLKRPIINTRDEPHADPEKYRRLHVIIGDANLAEISTYLKVGTTSLVLAMIEARFIDARPGRGAAGAGAARGLARPDAAASAHPADGRKLTAVQLQMEYLDLARKFVEDRLGADADAQTLDVLGPLGVGADPPRDRPDAVRPRARLGGQAAAARAVPRPRRPGVGRRQAAPHRPAVRRRTAGQGALPPAGLGWAGSSGCSPTRRCRPRCTGRPRTPGPTSAAAAWRSTPTRSRPRRGTRSSSTCPAGSRSSGCRRSTRCAGAERTSGTAGPLRHGRGVVRRADS